MRLRLSRIRRRRNRVFAASVVIAALIGLGVVAVGWARGWWIDATAPGTPPPAAAELTTQERAYYAFVGPRMHVLLAETQTLDRLGAEKSRNIFVLERGYNQVTGLITQIGDYEKQHGVPPRFAPAHAEYAAGAAQVQQAMNQAESAFLHFQWDKVAKARTVFDQGVASLARAVAALDREGGGPRGAGTPVASGAGRAQTITHPLGRV